MTSVSMENKPKDHHERDPAIRNLDDNMIVLAGAGTGKTTILIDRLTLLIVGKGIPVERVVALTFTKKAAEEMRSRLDERLRKIHEGKEPYALLEETFPDTRAEWAERAGKALENLPRAKIGTIHSFAADLLRLFPIQAGVDPRFQPDEGLQYDLLFNRLWDAWMSDVLRPGHDQEKGWVEIFSRHEVDDVKAAAHELGRLIYPREALEKDALPKQVIEAWAQDAENALIEIPITERGKKKAERVSAIRSVFAYALEGKTPPPEIIEAVEAFSASNETKLSENAKQRVSRARSRALALSQRDEGAIARLLEVLDPFLVHLRNESRREGVVPMDALLVLARDLLKKHPLARKDVKRRFDVFLIDEFQDTDPLQGEILFFLAENPEDSASDWRQVKLGPARLFVVGDPKQSIYRFRGADIAAFQDFQTAMKKQKAFHSTLGVNFRSSADLIRVFNRAFDRILVHHPGLQSAYTPLEPWREKGAEPGLNVVRVFHPDDKAKAPVFQKTEAEIIADKILKETAGAAGRPFSDFAILFRSTTPYDVYLSVFKEKGIPYVSEGEKAFYQTNEATQFLNLLSAAADSSDSLALVGVLRSPIGGLSDEEILDLSLKGRLNYTRPAISSDKAQAAFDVLSGLHMAAESLSVPEFIDHIFQKTPVIELMFQSSYGEQGVANLLKIRSLAESWTAREPMTLLSFIARFKSFRQDERAEGENPLADANFNAVKIMTIHKAKGLEFPVVFLPNLFAGRSPKGLTKPVLEKDWATGRIGLRLLKEKKINGAMAWIEDQIIEREEAEERRVFYVAMTRARQKLHIFTRTGARSTGLLADLVGEAGLIPSDQGDGIRVEADYFPVESFQAGIPIVSKGGAAPSHPAKEWNADDLKNRLAARKKQFEKDAARILFSSPTREMKKEREDEKPVWRGKQEEPGRPSNPVMVGDLCHAVLETWDFSSPPKDLKKEIGHALSSAALRLEVNKKYEQDADVWREAEEILNGFLAGPAAKKLSAVDIIGREVPFILPWKGDAEGMRGAVDLLYRERGRLIIGDYKSNKVDADNKVRLIEKYKTQGSIYKEAVKAILGEDADFELIFLRTGEAARI